MIQIVSLQIPAISLSIMFDITGDLILQIWCDQSEYGFSSVVGLWLILAYD